MYIYIYIFFLEKKTVTRGYMDEFLWLFVWRLFGGNRKGTSQKGTSTNKDIDPIVNEDRAGHPRFVASFSLVVLFETYDVPLLYQVHMFPWPTNQKLEKRGKTMEFELARILVQDWSCPLENHPFLKRKNHLNQTSMTLGAKCSLSWMYLSSLLVFKLNLNRWKDATNRLRKGPEMEKIYRSKDDHSNWLSQHHCVV